LTGYFPGAVKIFNQTRRVIIRDNLILEQPNSNGVWYDVGNRDGVFVNNYVEGAQVGFFFEISRGVTVAGNVFAHNGKGLWILNSDKARIYNNTFIDNPAAFEHNERTATGDVFAWHSTTGPDFDKRDGHIFVNNLLVASETYRDPLLRLEQPASLCTKLTKPQTAQLDGNVYMRPSTTTGPLAIIAPAEGCTAYPATLADLHKLGVEAKGKVIDASARAALKSPDFDRFELKKAIPAALPLPDDVRKFVGWSKAVNTVGAYPFRK
jgi:parallel beta-helix repeat protein